MHVCSVTFNSLQLQRVNQAPQSMGLSQQEYWSELPFPPPGIFPTQELNLWLLHWQTDSFTTDPLGKPCNSNNVHY